MLAPPVDSYGSLPAHGAAEREGHSQISRFLPAESAAPLPQHDRQRTETTSTTCARRASTPRSSPPRRVAPDPARRAQGEYIDAGVVAAFSHVWYTAESTAARSPRPGQRALSGAGGKRGQFLGPTLPPAGNTKPRRRCVCRGSSGLVPAAWQHAAAASVIVETGQVEV